MNTSNQISELKKLLERSGSILLTSHTSPDPDAVCSLLLLGTTLKVNYPEKSVSMVLEEMPEDLDDLEGYDQIVNEAVLEALVKSKPDLFIMVDGVNFDRCSRDNGQKVRSWLDSNRETTKTVIIDHHETIDKDEVSVFLNQTSPSTTQDIYSICFKEFGLKKPPGAIETSLLGIYADTGGFVYLNGKHHQTFEIVNELLDQGGNIETIRYKINSYSEPEMKVFAEMANRISHQDGYTYSSISDEFVDKWKASGSSVSSLHKGSKIFLDNYIRNIDDRNWGFIVYRDQLEKGNTYSVSLRSANGVVDVSVIARKLNGGGHKAAAGGRFEAQDIEQAINEVKKVIAGAANGS